MKKILFPKELDKKNISLREYLLGIFSRYVDLKDCELLEIGCGNGRFATLLGPKIKSYTGIEPDGDYLRIAKETTPPGVIADYHDGLAEEVPIKNRKFDVILYAFSWHFISDFDKAVNEVKRLLKDDGIVVIYEPSKLGNDWTSPKLRKGNPEFDEKLHKKKMKDLDKGREAINILHEKGLFIVEKEVDKGGQSNLWVLKLDEN